jgi:hypothetical protein
VIAELEVRAGQPQSAIGEPPAEVGSDPQISDRTEVDAVVSGLGHRIE